MTIGLITGSGLQAFSLEGCEALSRETEFRRVELQKAWLQGQQIYLLRRHGPTHSLPPHRINYRANIRALYDLGCEIVLATNAVGSLRAHIAPGEFVLPDQFIDCTKLRPTTFFEGVSEENALSGTVAQEFARVRHIDMTEPYCPHVRMQLISLAEQQRIRLHPAGTYICTEGPRFETPAEIRAYAQWGADVVGMTGVPEVVLARELGMCYASICLVTNRAAGLGGARLSAKEIEQIASQQEKILQAFLHEALCRLQNDPDCLCHHQD